MKRFKTFFRRQTGTALCYRCKRPLPAYESSQKRNQYIEGCEYIVHNFSSPERYFQSTEGDVKYMCYKCMFNVIPDPFQLPKSLNLNLSKETYLNVHTIHQDTVNRSDFRNNTSNYNIVDVISDRNEITIDRKFYESLVKSLWVESIPGLGQNEILVQFYNRYSQSNQNDVDWILLSLFHMYIRDTKCAHICKDKDSCVSEVTDPNSLRAQIICHLREDQDWLVSCLLDIYVHFVYKDTDKIIKASHIVSAIVSEWTNELPSRAELSSFLLCLISVCFRVGTQDHSTLGTEYSDHFQNLMFQSSRNENTKWVRHCSKYYVQKKVSKTLLDQYADMCFNIFQLHPWDLGNFDQFIYIIQRRFLHDSHYLKECIEIMQYQGISSSKYIFKLLDECPVTQIPAMLKQVAISGKDKQINFLLEELKMHNNIPLELLEKCRTTLDIIKKVLINIQHYTNNTDFKNCEELKTFVESYLSRYNVDSTVVHLACAAYAMYRFRKYKPRNVQLLSAILFLINTEEKGLLLQIHTGEGKSCVIAMTAATLICLNKSQTVDIITSSALLATRDFMDWVQYFNFFGITACTNVNVVGENNLYDNNIVLGTVETFSADILRHDFQQTNIRGERQFKVAIVDEVDSMLLDRGIQFTYLTQMIAGMRHLEPILSLIWYHVSEFVELKSTENEIFFHGAQLPFYSFISNIVAATISDGHTVQEYVLNLLHNAEYQHVIPNGFCENYARKVQTDPLKVTELLDQHINNVVNNFLAFCERELGIKFKVYEMVDQYNVCSKVSSNENPCHEMPTLHVLSLKNGHVCDLHCGGLDEVCSLIESKVISGIFYSKGELDESAIYKVPIPINLKKIVNTQIKTWISNAFEAKKMQRDREYLVNNGAIHPIDFKHTGLIESNKKWGDGLQQFLEMKHSLAISPMTLITNYLSNVALFKKYDRIYGLSGTLGSASDYRFLDEVYETSTYKIPSHKPNKLIDLGGTLKHSKEEWLDEICCIIKTECKLANYQTSRAALVIAEDIITAKQLEVRIQTFIPENKLKLYTRSETKEVKVVEDSLQQGEIIISTNLAGRGTDIKVSDKVNENGGLFVLLTFLPFNERVELQAKGRTSRKGEPGSTKMILLSNTIEKSSSNVRNFTHLIQLRDENERNHTVFMKREIDIVMAKDHFFQIYCNFLKDFCSNNAEDNEDKVQILHENWGVWLKHYSSDIEDKPGSGKKLVKDLKNYLSELQNEFVKGKVPTGCIYNIIKIGNSKFVNKDYETAKKYFTKAIDTDKMWSSIAHYNRAFCTLRINQEGRFKEAIVDLENAATLLNHYLNEITFTMTCIQQSRVTHEEKLSEGNFAKHMHLKFQVLNFLSNTIQDSIAKINHIEKTNLNANYPDNDIMSTSVLFDDTFGSDGLYEVWQLGLTKIFAVEKRPTIIGSQVIVIAIGAAQVLVGAMLIPLTGGILTHIAVGLVCEGISDIIGSTFAMVYGREFSWKSWGIKKGVNIAVICLLPCVMKYGGKVCTVLITKMEKGRYMKLPVKLLKLVKPKDAKAMKSAIRTCKLIAAEVTQTFVSHCSTYVIEPYIMELSVEITRRLLVRYINPIMENLLLQKEVAELIIRIEQFSITSENNNLSEFSNIRNIGEDILLSQINAGKGNLESQNEKIRGVMKIINLFPNEFKLSKYQKVLKVIDVCKQGLQLAGSGMIECANSVREISVMISETYEGFKQGLVEYCDKKKIPFYEDTVKPFTDEESIPHLSLFFTNIICDSYANLFEQFVAKSCYNRVLNEVDSLLSKLEVERKTYRNAIQTSETIESGAKWVKELLHPSDKNDTALQDNISETLSKAARFVKSIHTPQRQLLLKRCTITMMVIHNTKLRHRDTT